MIRPGEILPLTIEKPAAGGRMESWDLDDLRVVPAGAKPRKPFDSDDDGGEAEESELHELRVIADDVAAEPVDAKFTGPQKGAHEPECVSD